MPIDTKHEDLQGLRIDRQRARRGRASDLGAALHHHRNRSCAFCWAVGALAYRLLARTRPRWRWCAPPPRAAETTVGGVGSLRHRLYRGPSQNQRELQGNRPGAVDRRGKGRPRKRRPGAGPPGRRRVPGPISSKRMARRRALAPITRNCRTAPARKRSSRRSITWMKPAPRWWTTRSRWIAPRTSPLRAWSPSRRSMTPPPSSKPISSAPIRWNAGIRPRQDRPPRRGDRARQGRDDPSRRPGGLRQVAARRHADPRPGDAEPSSNARRKKASW